MNFRGEEGSVYHAMPLFIMAILLGSGIYFKGDEFSDFFRISQYILIGLLLLTGLNLCLPKTTLSDVLEGEGKKYKEYLKHLPNIPPKNDQTMLLDDVLEQLDDRSIQLIIRDTSQENLAIALSGSSGKVRMRFIENMGSRGSMILVEDIKRNLKEATDVEVKECQQEIVELFKSVH